jgi:endonuclease YncB( thermonuclease family)
MKLLGRIAGALITLVHVQGWPLVAAAQSPALALPCGLEPGPVRAVASVVDGETLRLDDRIEVRLIGAMMPRASDASAEGASGLWRPEIDARAALHALAAGRSVTLAMPETQIDRYGRTLAHVFLDENGQRVWLQGRLVEIGWARAYAIPGSEVCAAELLQLERRARDARLGLWTHAAYEVRPADRPAELSRYRHTFQLVRGRVEKVRGSRSMAILEMPNIEGPSAVRTTSRKGAFRIVWRRAMARRAELPEPDSLVGRRVLVRGWIEGYGGPEIEIMTKGQLEIED